jgi:hypothetical protein
VSLEPASKKARDAPESMLGKDTPEGSQDPANPSWGKDGEFASTEVEQAQASKSSCLGFFFCSSVSAFGKHFA